MEGVHPAHTITTTAHPQSRNNTWVGKRYSITTLIVIIFLASLLFSHVRIGKYFVF